MGVDARTINTTKNSKDVGDDDNNNKKGQSLIVDDDDYKNVSSNSTFWIVIRHNLGLA
jgi:hypothetical protein